MASTESTIFTLQFVSVTAEWLVDSIGGLTNNGKISKEFVGVILLPIVSNASGVSTNFAMIQSWIDSA
jgi:Ca2+/H+ antiporter